MSRTMKIRKLKLFYFQKNARYRAKELCRNIFLGNLSLNEGKISVGLPVLILEFWWRHVKTKNRGMAMQERRGEGGLDEGETIVYFVVYAYYFFSTSMLRMTNTVNSFAIEPSTISKMSAAWRVTSSLFIFSVRNMDELTPSESPGLYSATNSDV